MFDIYASFDNVPLTTQEDSKRRGALPLPGKHLVRLDNIRESKDNVYGFHFDYTVVEGPSGEGTPATRSVFPFSAPLPGKDGKIIPQKTKTERDIATIKKHVAALFGIQPTNLVEVAAKVNNEVLRRVVGTKESPSTLRGRLVYVTAVPSNGKNPTYVQSMDPYLVDGNVVDAEGFTPGLAAAPAAANTNAAPPPPAPVAPAAPAELPRFPHPAMPGHTYDASGAIFDASGKKVN